ncbi:hypothetical protein ACFQ6V_23690 [Streptomyces roseifaciens]
MHDPLTVAFEIRLPWPRQDTWRTEQAARTGTRWRLGGAFAVIAGRGLRWPTLFTIWHRDPSGYDGITCRRGMRQLHVHHWRIQVPLLQDLRRRLLTRCAWCRGRSVKGDVVSVSRSWDGPRSRWWQGEPDLYHRDCSAIKSAHATCVCEQPVLEHDDYGRCARCDRSRSFGMTADHLARARSLSAIPSGSRRADVEEQQ